MSFTLTQEEPVSESFDVHGDCYICIEGSGEVAIERKIGDDFKTVTTDRGEPMVFVGSGVLFNDKISCKKAIKHRIKANTSSEVVVDIVKEKR